MKRALCFSLMMLSCATMNTEGMSPQCRDFYNACLNRCPQSSNRVAPGADLGELAKSQGGAIGGGGTLEVDVASCTRKCNDEQKSCK